MARQEGAAHMSKPPKCEMIGDGEGIYIVLEGVKIGKARTWVSLEPGYAVFDERSGKSIWVTVPRL
jgi:hypothetical protein